MFKKIPALMADPLLEKNGIRVEINIDLEPETEGGEPGQINAWILVRRAGGNNRAWDRIATALRKPHKYMLDNETLSPDKLEVLNRTLYADACVADFGGFPGEDNADGTPGEEPTYSQEGARALMETYSAAYTIVRTTANSESKYCMAAHNIAADQAKKGSPGN
jgi:hypothetical protein